MIVNEGGAKFVWLCSGGMRSQYAMNVWAIITLFCLKLDSMLEGISFCSQVSHGGALLG